MQVDVIFGLPQASQSNKQQQSSVCVVYKVVMGEALVFFSLNDHVSEERAISKVATTCATTQQRTSTSAAVVS